MGERNLLWEGEFEYFDYTGRGEPSDVPHGGSWRGQGRSTAIHGRLAHAQTSPQPQKRHGKSPGDVAQMVSAATKVCASEIKPLHVA